MKPGLFQILVIVLIVLVLFGRGRISDMMSDFGKGIRSFRKGLDESDGAASRLDGSAVEARAASEISPDKTAG